MALPHARSRGALDEDVPEPDRGLHLVRDVLIPGALAGMLGAGVMALVAMAISGVSAHDVWRPARLVAGVLYRDLPPTDARTVLLGLLIHATVAGGLATLFALLLPRGGTAVAALALAMLYALGLQAVMPYLVVPWASPPLHRAGALPVFLVAHLGFGASLAIIPSVRRLTLVLDRARRGWRRLVHALG